MEPSVLSLALQSFTVGEQHFQYPEPSTKA